MRKPLSKTKMSFKIFLQMINFTLFLFVFAFKKKKNPGASIPPTLYLEEVDSEIHG